MTYNSWKIRENGLKRIGVNFKPASLQYNPDYIRVSNYSEAQISDDIISSVSQNNNEVYKSYTIKDAILKTSPSRHIKLSRIFANEQLIDKKLDENGYKYLLGVKGRTDKFFAENCKPLRTTCLDGESDTRCLPNKCYGGDLAFSILNESIIKLDITRGNIQKSIFIKNKFFNQKNPKISDYYIRISHDSEDLLYYQDDDKEFYKTISGKIRLPLNLIYEINGHSNFLKDFFDSILIFLFRNTCEGPIEICVKDSLFSRDTVPLFKQEFIERISLSDYSDFLKQEIYNAIETITYYAELNEFASQLYDIVYRLFNSISYVIDSSFSFSKKISFKGELKGRPIYSRLPSSNFGYNTSGLEENIIFVDNLESRFSLENLDSGQIVVLNDRSEGYKYTPRYISSYKERISFGLPEKITDTYDKDQIYSPKDPESWRKLEKSELPPVPVTKWVTEGADQFLAESKEKIDRFFADYLDPDTCFSENLDWLAQHIGLNDSLYFNFQSEKIKRILIKNALGWYSSELEFEVKFPNEVNPRIYKTIKGKVLDDIPFNSSQWSSDNFTKYSFIKSNTISGVNNNGELFSQTDLDGNILFDKILKPEVRRLTSSDSDFIYVDSDFSYNYDLISVRFISEYLPEELSESEKYFLNRISQNKYEIYNEFGYVIKLQPSIYNFEIFIENQLQVELESIPHISYNKNAWEGIYQSKGSRIGLAFALSLPLTKTNRFVHSHVLEEIKQSELSPNSYIVKSGLREYELENVSSLLRPWERQYIQVGNEFGSFQNQLIAGISEVKEDDSYDMVFRLPFYYNRNGRTWNHVNGIRDNWIPINVSTRVQYPYLASELWSVGDAFFELEIDE